MINLGDEEKLDDLQEELIREEEKNKKIPMPVSGKSVFEIKKIKEKKED